MTEYKRILCFSMSLVILLVCGVFLGLYYKNAQPDTKETMPTKVQETQTQTQTQTVAQTEETKPTTPSKHMIDGVEYKAQSVYTSACETYSCVMLLQYLGYDIDEHEFVESYLVTKPLYYGTGPDMDAAYAGDAFEGCGVNAPAMALFMNKYLSTTDMKNKAYALKDVSLDKLCKEYIFNNIPVMVWATTFMEDKGYVYSWTINYVGESSTAKLGDTESWYEKQHCMLLIGYDENYYYFADPMSGGVSTFEKKLSQTRYEQMGSQAVVVK
ncbi:MAG: C39 family peptidase [Ruminococcus sp.]|nr:C39 family peptidase [Ruminococcus sp.]